MNRGYIDSITIEGLFGDRSLNYTLPFRDNWLVIKASNGRGKTTLLRILYHYLSGQWERLSSDELRAIKSCIDGMLQGYYHLQKRSASQDYIPESIQELYRREPRFQPIVYDKLFSYTIDQLKKDIDGITSNISLDYGAYEPALKSMVSKILKEVLEVGKPPLQGIQLLFFPTYRRIERSAEEVFPGFSKFLASRLMENVAALSIQKEYNYEALANGQTTEEQVMAELQNYWHNNATMETHFSPQNNLYYQSIIGFGVDDIKSKLQEFWSKIPDKEAARQRIYQWRDLCNQFMVGDKQLCYSKKERQIHVQYQQQPSELHELRILSSGEKQIISLFAHILFSEHPVFLILDEPELSLSEAWQHQLMEQLWKLHRDQILVGVLLASHSKVVLAHNKGKYTHDLDDLRQNAAY